MTGKNVKTRSFGRHTDTPVFPTFLNYRALPTFLFPTSLCKHPLQYRKIIKTVKGLCPFKPPLLIIDVRGRRFIKV